MAVVVPDAQTVVLVTDKDECKVLDRKVSWSDLRSIASQQRSRHNAYTYLVACAHMDCEAFLEEHFLEVR